MSLIGPRPDPLDDMDIYTEHQKKKLAVRPGITGYNQAYYRNSVEQLKWWDWSDKKLTDDSDKLFSYVSDYEKE